MPKVEQEQEPLNNSETISDGNLPSSEREEEEEEEKKIIIIMRVIVSYIIILTNYKYLVIII